MRRKYLQPLVTNPVRATKLEDITVAVERWESNIRLFKESGGVEPDDEAKRLIVVEIIPPEMSVHVTMQMHLHTTYPALRLHIRNYVRVVMHQRQVSGNKGLHLIDQHEPAAAPEQGGEEEMSEEDYAPDILAFMKTNNIPVPNRCLRRPPGRPFR